MQKAFENIKVLDLSSRLSGAWAARLFGDFGAEVILAEGHEGHIARHLSPKYEGKYSQESLVHQFVNWNKYSSSQDAKEIQELIACADIVITTDGILQIDNSEIDAIHLSITAHGLTGPWSNIPGNDLTHSANSGWAMINKYENEEPLQLPTNQPSFIAGVAGFVAASAALHRGSKELIDVSELEATALTCVPWAIMGIFIGGDRLQFGPNRRKTRGRPGPLWQARDGMINYGYGDWQQWQNAMHFLGQDSLAEDPDYIPSWGRHQKDAIPIIDGLAESSKSREKWKIFHGLADFRCISGVVQNTEELSTNEQLKNRNFLVTTNIEDQTFKTCGAPSKLSESPWQLYRAAPSKNSQNRRFSSKKIDYPAASELSKPLEGTRVLCFTQAWAGTFATEILACLGAEVVQIETVKRPDVWRGAGAPVPDAIKNPSIKQSPLNTNGMYNSVNLNKKAITLDVTQPKGKEIFWSLIKNFDVLVDNFSPHVMTDWGVSLETLRAKRPDIIFASVSGYGRQGPLAEYPANGATTEPMSGFSSMHGYEGDPGMNTGGLIPDPISGYYLAASIVTAMHHRKQSGIGQRIDSSMMESVAIQFGDALLEYEANEEIRKPMGNKHPDIAPHGLFQSKDGAWVALAAENDQTFQNLCAFLKTPDLANDIRFITTPKRKTHELELNKIVGESFKSQFHSSQLDKLQSLGIHAAVCRDFLDIYKKPNPQFLHRDFMQKIDHPEAGSHLLPTMPWTLKYTQKRENRPSPCFGEHSQDVFFEELGIGQGEYLELVSLNITGTERLT
ncbi:CoA transferase [Gammaproteobacteria bacterium]|nr:CoA transferase [Gammaproteobacteria bacterium]